MHDLFVDCLAARRRIRTVGVDILLVLIQRLFKNSQTGGRTSSDKSQQGSALTGHGISICERICCETDKDKLLSFCTVGNEDPIHGVQTVPSPGWDSGWSRRKGYGKKKYGIGEKKYGIGENGIWVSGASKQIFDVCLNRSFPQSEFYCETKSGGELNYCSVGVGNLIYDLIIDGPGSEVIPGECQLGENYGHTGTHIWVKEKCEAQFTVNYFPKCTEIKCSSNYGLPAKCYVPPEYKNHLIESVSLTQTNSLTACVLDETYTVGNNFIKDAYISNDEKKPCKEKNEWSICD
ncbi:hypothetical protein ScPMuIL_012464 [Solemya velum]